MSNDDVELRSWKVFNMDGNVYMFALLFGQSSQMQVFCLDVGTGCWTHVCKHKVENLVEIFDSFVWDNVLCYVAVTVVEYLREVNMLYRFSPVTNTFTKMDVEVPAG